MIIDEAAARQRLDEVYDHAAWLMQNSPAWHVHKFLRDAHQQYGYTPADVARMQPLPQPEGPTS